MHDFDKLELNTETIRELTGSELAEVAGGRPLPTLQGCLTGIYPTFDGCPSFDCTQIWTR